MNPYNRSLNRFLAILLAGVFLSIGIVACSDNDNEWGGTPLAVRRFVSEYFPGQTISDYNEENGILYVRLKNSAALQFDASDYNWISVNGYGEVLPSQFLFDRLPPALYEYLQSTSALNGVYSVSRDLVTGKYRIELLDCTVIFDSETGKTEVTQ